MKRAINYFLSANPYCVLGTSRNASQSEVISAQEKIEKLGTLRAEDSYMSSYFNENLPKVNQSTGIV